MNQQQLITFVYIVALFALLYFFMIRPQQQRQKKHQQMIRNMKVNDKIVTIGGLFGEVVKMKEDTVVIRVADNVRLEFLKTAVSQIREQEEIDRG